MKLKAFSVALAMLGGLFVASCSTDVENLDVQPLKKYDEQYYSNLRAFKKSNHEVSYAYYEAWSPVEGVGGYKDPASWGERIMGLPDSIDIVNLWMGVPTNDSTANGKNFVGTTYAPVAYDDMKYCQRVKGTRFVMHADASHYRHKFTVDGKEYDMGGQSGPSDEIMAAYAKWIANTANEPGLDGVDVDFEGWNSNDLVRLLKELSKYFGPKSPNPETLLIVDYFGGEPSAECNEYCNYFVQQAYSNQVTMTPARNLPDEKMIYCETFGVFYADGGKLLEYAAWEPSNGKRKGGCGVFFLGRNYDSASGIPYNEFRKAIQIMNPALNN